MNAPVPTRHPSSPQPVPAVVRMYANILGTGKPTAEEWARFGASLTVGDKPMDDLVEWMHSAGMRQTRPLFEKALADGIDSVPNAPEPLRRFFDKYENPPEWVDFKQIRRGQRAMRSAGADGMYVARDVSLLGGYMFSGFNKTLLRTGALKKGSNKRFTETAQWAMDVMSEGGLEPHGVGYRSTIRVRMIHAFVRRHVSAMPDWRADEWGLPVNQTDMAATLLGALIAPGLGAPAMGLIMAPADGKATTHVARYVGWLIGVEDEWLPRSFPQAVGMLYQLLTALSDPDETTQMLSVPMVSDPLQWKYSSFPWLRRRIARSAHLSITSAFLGPSAMRTLGLPPFVLPWYPVVRFPVNLAHSVAAMTLPGGMDRAAARGWRSMQEMMHMMGGDNAQIGDSAAHVSHAA